MQKTSPSAPLRVLTAQNVFDLSFNFDFLIEKAAHELTLSRAEGPNFFYWHAMNFSVSIHAIADHLWWVKAIDDPQWNKYQPNFVNGSQMKMIVSLHSWIYPTPINTLKDLALLKETKSLNT